METKKNSQSKSRQSTLKLNGGALDNSNLPSLLSKKLPQKKFVQRAYQDFLQEILEHSKNRGNSTQIISPLKSAQAKSAFLRYCIKRIHAEAISTQAQLAPEQMKSAYLNLMIKVRKFENTDGAEEFEVDLLSCHLLRRLSAKELRLLFDEVLKLSFHMDKLSKAELEEISSGSFSGDLRAVISQQAVPKKYFLDLAQYLCEEGSLARELVAFLCKDSQVAHEVVQKGDAPKPVLYLAQLSIKHREENEYGSAHRIGFHSN